MIFTTRLRSSSSTCIYKTAIKRSLSNGALAGGFTSEALQQWATHHWDDKNGPYVDLFYEKVSPASIEYLNEQKHPSSELTKCYFTSNQFIPERFLISPVFPSGVRDLPEVFSLNEQYLAWTVAVQTPLEIICTWQLNETVKGCTMIAYDPVLRRVYNGNGIHSSVTNNSIFHATLPFHTKYAKLLLSGMAQELEKRANV